LSKLGGIFGKFGSNLKDKHLLLHFGQIVATPVKHVCHESAANAGGFGKSARHKG
jgi:hypothetical protein